MEKLRVLMPQLGDMVRALALAKSDWDLDKAVNMLRSFQVAHLDKVNVMNKARRGGMESHGWARRALACMQQHYKHAHGRALPERV